MQATWEGQTQTIYLYLLIEFQSSIDATIPLRLMHYVACFYSHLLKSRRTTPNKGLPPVFPLVLYNGIKRWQAPVDIRQMIKPPLPDVLSVFQPSLRYYLIDEGAYTDEQLQSSPNAVSGIFAVEKASGNYRQMQQAVDRIVEIIRKDPNKERIDRVVTRWLKRHLHYLGDSQNWSRIHSLIEDHAMIAENIRTWEEKARAEGIQQGMQQGMQQGYERAKAEAEQRLQEMVFNMVQSGLSDEQIISIADISPEQLAAIKLKQPRH